MHQAEFTASLHGIGHRYRFHIIRAKFGTRNPTLAAGSRAKTGQQILKAS